MKCLWCRWSNGRAVELWHRWSDVRAGEWGGASNPFAALLHHSSFYSPSVALPMSQALQVLHLASRPCTGGWKNSLWWTSLLQQATKFRSSYSFGWLRILLRAVNLFSFSHIVSSDSSFNIHNALYFVKYPSRASQNSPEGRMRPADRGLKTPALWALRGPWYWKCWELPCHRLRISVQYETCIVYCCMTKAYMLYIMCRKFLCFLRRELHNWTLCLFLLEHDYTPYELYSTVQTFFRQTFIVYIVIVYSPNVK